MKAVFTFTLGIPLTGDKLKVSALKLPSMLKKNKFYRRAKHF